MPSRRLQQVRALFSKIWPTHDNSTNSVTISPGNLTVHDLARIAGVSVLRLPSQFAPSDLVLPTRFAALAQYLVNFGMSSPHMDLGREIVDVGHRCFVRGVLRKGPGFDVQGLFRIPGSTVIVARLRGWFERQVWDFDEATMDDPFSGGASAAESSHAKVCSSWSRKSAEVDYTVRCAMMPKQDAIPYQVHDVASCLKGFLTELEGGVFGGLLLFEGLREAICPSTLRRCSRDKDFDSHDHDDSSSLEWKCVGVQGLSPQRSSAKDTSQDVDPKDIAHILCSGPCSVRRNLVFAVFGLLAFFKVDPNVPRESTIIDLGKQKEEVHYHSNPSVQSVIDEIRQPRGFIEKFQNLQVPQEARMTSDSLGRIFAPIFLDETRMKQIKLDVRQVRALIRGRRTRSSWGIGLVKDATPKKTHGDIHALNNVYTPTNPGESVRSVKTGRTITTTTADGSPLPRSSNRKAQIFTHTPIIHLQDKLDAMTLLSKPLTPTVTTTTTVFVKQPDVKHYAAVLPQATYPAASTGRLLRRQISKLVVGRSSSPPRTKSSSAKCIAVKAKSMAALQEQQARILLVARVISGVVRVWEDVVVELRAMGYAD